MKMLEKETKSEMRELSNDELQAIYGGSWWEVRAINGEIWFIFHPYDE